MRRAYEAPEEPDASAPRRSPRTKKPRLPLLAPPRLRGISIASLPREILAQVFAYIKPTALLRTVSLTCKEWRAVSFYSLSRDISVHAYGRWAASPEFAALVATMQPQCAVCIGCQQFPENLVVEMPSVRHLSLAGTSGRCMCDTFTRLTSLTSVHISFGPPHDGALAVLRACSASLRQLHLARMPTNAALGDSVSGFRSLFAEASFTSLTELRITTQSSPHLFEAALSSGPLTARLRRLALHSIRRFQDHVLHRFLPASLTNLTSLSLMCFPIAADIRGFLAKCPALTELSLSVSSIMLHHVVDFAAPLLTELTLWTDSGAHSLADLARCTRLKSLEAPLSETLTQSQAVAARLTSATYSGPPSQPPFFPFMAHFTALTQLGITSDFAHSGPIQDLNLPHLETIEWSPQRQLPTHLIAYYFRRFLVWSNRLRQITYDNVALVQHSKDLLELTHFLEEANVHARFAQLVCCVPDALHEEVKWFARHWRDITVTVLSAPEEEESLDELV